MKTNPLKKVVKTDTRQVNVINMHPEYCEECARIGERTLIIYLFIVGQQQVEKNVA